MKAGGGRKGFRVRCSPFRERREQHHKRRCSKNHFVGLSTQQFVKLSAISAQLSLPSQKSSWYQPQVIDQLIQQRQLAIPKIPDVTKDLPSRRQRQQNAPFYPAQQTSSSRNCRHLASMVLLGRCSDLRAKDPCASCSPTCHRVDVEAAQWRWRLLF